MLRLKFYQAYKCVEVYGPAIKDDSPIEVIQPEQLIEGVEIICSTGIRIKLELTNDYNLVVNEEIYASPNLEGIWYYTTWEDIQWYVIVKADEIYEF